MPYSNNLFYRFYDDGDGTKAIYPLVLLHGSGGSHMAWPVEIRRQIGRPVISLDLPGHGKSEGTACQRLPALVRSLHQFLQKLGIYHVDLAGHSLGALLALSYAQAHPQRANRLFLLSCGSNFNVPDELFEALLCPNRKKQFIELFSRIAFDESFPQRQRRSLLEPLNQVRTSTLLADISICAEFHLNGDFQEVKCPVSLVNGANDPIIPPASARQLAHILPQAALKILPKCGHLLLYEKTTLISRMMRVFFNQTTSRNL